MATFQDIIGQEQIVEHLKTAVKTDQVNHAYVIQGERSSGKEFIANVRGAVRAQLNNIDMVEEDGTIENLGEKYGNQGNHS